METSLQRQTRLAKNLISHDSKKINNFLNRTICNFIYQPSLPAEKNVSSSECLYHLGSNRGEEKMEYRGILTRDLILDRLDYQKLSYYISKYWYNHEISMALKYIIMKLFVYAETGKHQQRNRFQAYFKIKKDYTTGIYGKVYSLQTFLNESVPLMLKTINSDFLGYHEAMALLAASNSLSALAPNYNKAFAHFKCKEHKTPNSNNPFICSLSGGDDLHLIIDKIPGITFKRFLENNSYDLDDLASIIFQIYFALKIGQAQFSFVHGDLHNANIMITSLEEYKYIAYSYKDMNKNAKDEVFYVKARYLAVMIDYGLSRFNYKDPETGGIVEFNKTEETKIKNGPMETEDFWKFLNWTVNSIYTKRKKLPEGLIVFFNFLYFPEELREEKHFYKYVNEHVPPQSLDSYTSTTINFMNNPLLLLNVANICFDLQERNLIFTYKERNDHRLMKETGLRILVPEEMDLELFVRDLFSRDPTHADQDHQLMNIYELYKHFTYKFDDEHKKVIISRQEEVEREINNKLTTFLGSRHLDYRTEILLEIIKIFREEGKVTQLMLDLEKNFPSKNS